MKICTKCKIEKDFSCFGKAKNGKNGIRSACIKCNSAGKRKITSTKEGHIRELLSKARIRSNQLNVEFDLDIAFLLSIAKENCPVYGTKFNWGRGSGFNAITSPSLDRFDSAKGYTKDNVTFLSFKANRLKNNGSLTDLQKLVTWMEKQSG